MPSSLPTPSPSPLSPRALLNPYTRLDFAPASSSHPFLLPPRHDLHTLAIVQLTPFMHATIRLMKQLGTLLS